MKKIVLLGGVAAALGVSTQAATPERPNVIVILADDIGYGDLSLQGAQTIATPNIDRLGREGVRFTRGYASSATSTPSRYALMTGMYPWKNKDAKILPGDAPLLIDPQQETLPRMMQRAGYVTGAIGKWHLGMGAGAPDWNQPVTPGANEIGFDYSNLIAATNDRVPTVYVENGRVVNLDPNDPIQVSYEMNFEGEPTALTHPELLTMKWSHGHNMSIVNGIPRIGFMKGGEKARWKDEDMADYFVDLVKDFVQHNQANPFFLYYGLHQPHVPRAPHARFVGKSGMGSRGDAILEADWCVGELIKELTRLNLLEKTLIVFSSDNGPVLDDGYHDEATEKLGEHDPTGGLRGGKYSLFEAGTRVPFFVHWKGQINPTVSDAMICQMDLMPSFAVLCGGVVSNDLDGVNYVEVLLGRERVGRDGLVIEAMGRLAYRFGDYVYIPPYKGQERHQGQYEFGNLPVEALFNLRKDPKQLTNVAKLEPSKLAELKMLFLKETDGYYSPSAKTVY